MKILLTTFLIVCTLFCLSNAQLGSPIGSRIFAATFQLTNQNYGSGAVFPAQVWYNADFQRMRIDYFQPNGTLFLSVFYDYATKDQYQICGQTCQRATWTAAMPLTSGTAWTANSNCVSSDYTTQGGGPSYCASNCRSYNSNPRQAQGVMTVNYNDTTTNQMCLVRFTPAAGSTYGPEWQILTYRTSGYASNFDPTNRDQFRALVDPLFNAGRCPVPTCTSKLDIALVIDESGSIINAGQQQTVLDFTRNLTSSLTIGPDAVRMGVVFFSGDIGDRNTPACTKNQTAPGVFNNCQSCGFNGCCGRNCLYPCNNCGGKFRHATGQSVWTDKAAIIGAIDQIYGGMTCISCGVQQGTIILNNSPRAGVQKTIILFTDGQENVLTGRLASQASYARANGINIIAIGTYGYTYSDLQQLTTNDRIFTTNDFSGLQSLISQIISSVCEPLPNIETCDFCSGLCACKADCSCPTCNNFNRCKTSRCDPRTVANGGTQGVCVYTDITCDDRNPCTQNLCNSATGCDYSQPTPKPYAQNNFCFDIICNASLGGFLYTDIGTTQCNPNTGNNCLINYCNYTVGNTGSLTGSCQQVNTSDIPFGTSVSFRLPNNQTRTVAGCKRLASDPPCVRYNCQADGTCLKDTSTCVCQQNSDCNDNNGCTQDTCDTVNNRCVYTSIDCWSEISGGTCRINTGGLGQSTTTGNQYYTNSRTFPVDGNNLPTGLTTRSCDELACYGGRRSTYTCSSTGANSHVCQRSTSTCSSTGCADTFCRTLGTWTNNQFNTDCGGSATYTCTGANRCNTVACNNGFSGTLCQQSNVCVTNNGQNRCPLTSNATNCIGPNVCKIYSCDNTLGCQSTDKPIPANPDICTQNSCDPTLGNRTTDIGSTACSNNNKCMVTYCSKTENICKTIDRTALKTNESVTYTDSSGSTFTVTGCARADPANPPVCVQFGCNPTTGQCTVDSSTCNCQTNADCDDQDGCTEDACDTFGNTCTHVRKDCWSEFSGGNCRENQDVSSQSTTAEGVSAWLSGVTTPWTGAVDNTLTCAKMACYGGQRSQYRCVSQSSQVGVCQRITTDCPKGGCIDKRCQSTTTWTQDTSGNFQLGTNCNNDYTPACNSNACGTSVCNTAYVYPGNAPFNVQDTAQRCTFTSNASSCTGNTACFLPGQCNVNTGCDYSVPIPVPNNPASTCFSQTCDPVRGYILTDISANCGAPADACQFKYCNTTTNQCVTINSMDLPFGTSTSYVDSTGATVTVTGCAKPASDVLACRTYGCNATTGQCFQDVSTCNCITDDNCFDGTGCTIDTCNKALNRCDKITIDCLGILSNYACNSTTQTPYAADTTVGYGLYDGTAPANNAYSTVDSNNLPSPQTLTTRTCAQMGCYNGQPSKYSCFSTQEGSYTCQRSFESCNRNGCQDNICRTLGTWTRDASNNWQIDADCGTVFRPNCADNNACTNDFCNITWVPQDPVSLRCVHQLVNETQFCDDGNFCTKDRCDPGDTSGSVCTHTLYDQRTLRRSICPQDNVDRNCTTVECTVNRCIYTPLVCPDSTLCVLNKCNATTNNKCVSFFNSIYVIDACGVCAGDGTSCVPNVPAEPKRTSIAVALGVGLGVGLCVAAIIIGILTRTGYSAYAALAMEVQGSLQTNPTHVDNADNYTV